MFVAVNVNQLKAEVAELSSLKVEMAAVKDTVNGTFNSLADQLNFVCLFVCLLLNGTSALFRPLVPRIVEIEHTNHVKNDLK